MAGRSWQVTVLIAVGAGSGQQARSVVNTVLAAMNLPEIGAGDAMEEAREGLWMVEIQVSPSLVVGNEPDDAETVLSMLRGEELGMLTWRCAFDFGGAGEGSLAGVMEWPPSLFAVAGREEVCVHPAVRALLLKAEAAGPDSP